jgi:hypothetical protein
MATPGGRIAKHVASDNTGEMRNICDLPEYLWAEVFSTATYERAVHHSQVICARSVDHMCQIYAFTFSILPYVLATS